ncbi:C-Jun-amino-terminal kinase-interacting protein 4 [Triplophysa tibetana]|uniref:C-Jun-amino-terminal kinase-interacting protein 4 n=2 Tax=Cypriniformes TaxID=7952 RepID=A0A5A9N8H7_9TELE|nr:C-Jun-amino-terminal kinase-interacting protein 4 [Triplophysa tibetana]
MNIFRLTGDLSHLAAIIILLLKIWKTRSCAGISGKSQILFALVFTTRYLDLLTSFISLYNTGMKMIYIGCAYATVYLIYAKFRATYDGNHDTFRVEFLVVPVGGLSFLVNHDFSPLELFMISKTGEAETITTHYLFCLGVYRALYLFNWIWRFYFEGFFDMIAIVAGVVQTILYCDFFYLYVTKAENKSRTRGRKMELDDGVVYQDDPGTSAIMSERVSGLANSIYREFERLIRKYDEDVVKELMPLVVAVLENLDTVFAENQEHEVELELLKEDNEQLITQYEREKALRKHAEERFIELEDSQEQEKKDLQNHMEGLGSHSRQLELKVKNYADQISRLEEREAELKREYNSLHLRHTEMIHNYMEHVERIRLQQTGEMSDLGTLARVRKERPLSLGVFPMSGGVSSLTTDVQGRAEIPGMEGWRFNQLSHQRSNTSLKDELSDHSQGGSKSVTPMSTTASDLAQDSHREDGDGYWTNTEVQAVPATKTVSAGLDDAEEKSDVQAIIESTPELDMDLIGNKGSSTPTGGIENMAFDRNTDSLFEEVSSAGTGLIGDVDEGADLLGMGREVENLIQENVQLLETKNALNVVKNDLIARVDELSCEKEVLQGELEALLQAKIKLEEKIKEIEEELKNAAEEIHTGGDGSGPDGAQPIQGETDGAAGGREVDGDDPVNVTSCFSRLFSSSSSTTSSNTARALSSNVKYNPPSIMKKSNTFSQFPREKSKAFDFLKEEVGSSGSMSRREQKRAQYQHVKAHMQKEDGRVTNDGYPENKMNLPVPVCLKPLEQKDASMKLLCAAGVNVSGGWSCDGSSDVSGEEPSIETEASKRRKGSQSSLDQLEQQQKDREQTVHAEMSSRVWICTSTHSSTKVMIMDVTHPSDLIDSFYVCNSCVLCIASIPGVLEADYPAGEEIPQDLEAGPDVLLASTGSQCNEGVLSDVSAVGCNAEESGSQTGSTGANEQSAEHSPVKGSVDLSRASSEDGVPAAEEAMEATEEDQESPGQDNSQPGIYTEHVFTDPLGTESDGASTGADNQRESDQDKCEASAGGQTGAVIEETQRMSSALPTMWLGAQNGCSLNPSFFCITDSQWDLTNYHLLDLGRPHHSIRCMTVVHDKVWCGYRNKIYVIQPRAMKIEKSFSAHPRKESQVRQLAWVGDGIWVSIRLDSTLRLFHAHTFQHLQDVDIEPYVSKMLGTGKLGFSFVRITALMVTCNRLWVGTGNGVIISIPLSDSNGKDDIISVFSDSSLFVSLLLVFFISVFTAVGQFGFLGQRGGAIRVFGDETADTGVTGSYVPYCSMAHAQLCFHGHRDAVKFFVTVPGQVIVPGAEVVHENSTETSDGKSMLIMSGGEGYINFRIGDEDGGMGRDEEEESVEPTLKLQSAPAKPERSYVIVWQVAVGSE